MVLSFAAFIVVPDFGVTERGFVDVLRQEFAPLVLQDKAGMRIALPMRDPHQRWSRSRMLTRPSAFAPPAEDQHWIDKVIDLCLGFAERAPVHDSQSSLPLENLQALNACGLDTACLPLPYGSGLSFRTIGRLLTEMSAACPRDGDALVDAPGRSTSAGFPGQQGVGILFRG